MRTLKLGLLATTIAGLLLCAPPASAETTVKVGVLNDRSGLYTDLAGEGSVVAARMAVEDFKAAKHGLKIEIVSADHQNKADVGASITRQWIDVDRVDAVFDVPTSSVALAVNQVVKEKNKVFVNSGSGTSDLTGKACTPNTVHWTYDTWALANGTGGALVKQGGDTWSFITADYAFGLRPAFRKDGTVTAGNASGINDGAAALVLAGEAQVKRDGLTPFARIIGYAHAGVEPGEMGIGPVPAVRRLLERTGLRVSDFDVVESNEAFAAQACAVARELDFDPDRTNPNGGAIALGHPIGATGAILVVKLIHELRRTGGTRGLVTMCIGGGQGIALAVEAMS